LHLALVLRSLSLAVWFGSGIATVLATSAVFARAESRKAAGDIAGAILRRTNALRAVAAICFVLAALLGARGPATWLGGVCKMRRDLGGSVDALEPGDPRRRRFGALHGIAMLLLLLQVMISGGGLAAQ
jgi:hypothetical protein